MVKEIKEGLNEERDISYRFTNRFTIFKMVVYSKLIYRFSALPIKTLAGFWNGTIDPKFICKKKKKDLELLLLM